MSPAERRSAALSGAAVWAKGAAHTDTDAGRIRRQASRSASASMGDSRARRGSKAFDRWLLTVLRAKDAVPAEIPDVVGNAAVPAEERLPLQQAQHLGDQGDDIGHHGVAEPVIRGEEAAARFE